MPKIELETFVCKRCGHGGEGRKPWIQKEPGRIPNTCPKCKSPYWDRDRSRPKKILEKPLDIPDRVG